MNPVLFPAIIEIVVISYRTLTGKRMTVVKGGSTGFQIQTGSGPKRPPLPSELLAVTIVFSIYSVIAGDGSNRDRARLGALLGWGTVLATILEMFQTAQSGGTFPPGPTLSQRNQLTQPLPGTTNYPGGQF